MDNLSISIDPSQLQVSLEQTQATPPTPHTNRLSGKSSPLRGRCVKEYEEQLQQLQHENFNLKLRVFLLEERVGKALGRGDAADIIKNNIELKVENETLKKSLNEKCQLLSQASTAIEELENQQRATLATHKAEILSLKEQMKQLQKEAEEARLSARASILPDESTNLYAQAFGSFVLNPQSLTYGNADHQKIDEQAATDESTSKVSESQEQVLAYRQRIAELENEIAASHKMADSSRIIEQQNKILVEIQITLDEKQKQIEELEGALNDRKRKVEELEKSLSKAGRTLQGFVADIQKKEKDLELVKLDARKKDKRVKDLTAELKEAQELLNKAKWEAENSGREDNVKAMAEEENERLWAELEEKKRLLSAAEEQKALLQQDSDQLANLRLAVGQKEQAVAEAELQIATLKHQVQELTARLPRHSIDSAERKELIETVQALRDQLAAASKKASSDNQLRLYKKEVTVLRQRLADSTNACDILRTRLEEMADFLEEILSMSQSELANLSNWTSSKRRQALQHSIMQSRELSRSLSQSLMIGVDEESSSSKSPLPPPITEEVGCQADLTVVDQLRHRVAQLEEQVQLRDTEIAYMNNDKTIAKPPISSTPYYRPTASSISPVAPKSAGLFDESPPKSRQIVVSESEAWSEPDRTVSFARIGLPMQVETNSIAALLSNKKSRSHSNTGLTTGSDSSDSSKRAARRSRSDASEVKRSGNRKRLLEQENTKLRNQLSELIDSLRSTYDNHFDDSNLLDDSQKDDESEKHEITGTGDITTAHCIIDALQGRILKMKELVKRREQRLRETKDLATQLEFKVKEKYFQACENQLLIKETQEKLNEKSREVESLEARLIESQAEWAVKDRQVVELRSSLDGREAELRNALMKAQLWENSYQDSQKTLRQVESDLKAEQEVLVQSLEQQVKMLNNDFQAINGEKCELQKELDALKDHVRQMADKRSSIQRQRSQMSDYVSDQAASEDQAVIQMSESGSRPSTLHLSPDLGIDSDQGRFSSLEQSAIEQRGSRHQYGNCWNAENKSPKKVEATVAKGGLSPDVLTTSNCTNCPKWQNKYLKAKQTLAATLEKLQAANLRKEKVDRALNKELGKTHNILCQARGLLGQVNHAQN